MSTVHLRRSDPTVTRIIETTFPGFTGQHVEAVVTDTVSFYGTQWDSGCRRTYRVLRLADMLAADAINEAPFLRPSPIHETAHTIPPGFVVVVYRQSRCNGIEIH